MVRAASLALALLLSACAGNSRTGFDGTSSARSLAPTASPAQETSTAEWQEPTAYSFTLESRCGERNLIGRFAVEVENGEVIAVEGLDERGRTAAMVVLPSDMPTLADLLALAANAQNEGADRVNVVADAGDGHPALVEIDWNLEATDDEECYEVTDLVVGG